MQHKTSSNTSSLQEQSKPPESATKAQSKLSSKCDIPKPRTIENIDSETIQATIDNKQQQADPTKPPAKQTNFHKSSSDKVHNLDKDEVAKQTSDTTTSTNPVEIKEETIQDTIDTVPSGETLNPGKPKTEVNCHRYRLMLTMKKKDPEEYKKRHNLKTTPDWLTDKDKRLRKYLMEWFAQLLKTDETARILSWAKKENNILPKPDSIPSTEKKRKKFFVNAKAKEEGRIYCQVRLFSMMDPKDLIEAMEDWMTDRNMELASCSVQTEYSKDVGILAYTSQYTYVPQIKEYMEKITDFEWGFKLGPLSKKDKVGEDGKPQPFYKRSRALIPMVSARVITEAIDAMDCVFGYKKSTSIHGQNCPFADRYIFMRSEHDISSNESELFDAFQLLVDRHKEQERNVDGVTMEGIMTNLDKSIHTKLGTTSMRKMVYSITTVNSKGEVKPLFLNIDKTMDGSSVWFKNGRRGNGGFGYIFTYLEEHAKKATMMAKGLPIYLATVYGLKAVKNKFTSEAWTKVSGWKYDATTDTFHTPEAKLLANLMHNDIYRDVLTDVKSDQLHSGKAKSTETAMKEIAEKTLMMQLQQPDKDIQNMVQTAKDGKPIVDEVIVEGSQHRSTNNNNGKDDQMSTTSSITFDSKGSPSTVSNTDTSSQHSAETKVTSNSVQSAEASIKTFLTNNTAFSAINPKKLLSKWDHSLTEEENKSNLYKYAQHVLNKKGMELLQNVSSLAPPPAPSDTNLHRTPQKSNKRSIDSTVPTENVEVLSSSSSPRKQKKFSTSTSSDIDTEMDNQDVHVIKVANPMADPRDTALPPSPSPSMDLDTRDDTTDDVVAPQVASDQNFREDNSVNEPVSQSKENVPAPNEDDLQEEDSKEMDTDDASDIEQDKEVDNPNESVPIFPNFEYDPDAYLPIFSEILDLKKSSWTNKEKFLFRALAVRESVAFELFSLHDRTCDLPQGVTIDQVADFYIEDSAEKPDISRINEWVFPPKFELIEYQNKHDKFLKYEEFVQYTHAQGVGEGT